MDSRQQKHFVRFGLCGSFVGQPIRFRNTSEKSIRQMDRSAALAKLAKLGVANAESLLKALRYCRKHDIGCFRVANHLLPLQSNSECGYEVTELPGSELILDRLQQCAKFAHQHDIRLCFSADKLVVQSLLQVEGAEEAIADIEQQSQLAKLLGTDVIVLQLMQVQGAARKKAGMLEAIVNNVERLSQQALDLLTIENSDAGISPEDLLPVCHAVGIPLSYNVHHHRCCSDRLSVEQATDEAIATWNREPLFRISSPLDGWDGSKPKRLHDFVELSDFPANWREKKLTVEVAAKSGELAVRKLNRQLSEQWIVYILQCADGSLYTGITNNPERRLTQHNAGTASRYTRSRLPVTMEYQENQPSHGAALRRELEIKAMTREYKLRLIKTFR